MAREITADYLVEQCEQCGMLNVVHRERGDGSRCAHCAGAMRPMGYAILQQRTCSNIAVEVHVERSQLDRLIDDVATVHEQISTIAEKIIEIKEAAGDDGSDL